MRNRSLNRVQLLIWLAILCVIQIILLQPNYAASTEYNQWEANQKAHDLRLKQAITQPTNSGNYYLSRAEVSVAGSAGKISLNQANAVQLQELHGIGQKKAEAIVSYRTKNGKFKSIEEIQQVKGIGPVLFAKNKQRLAL